MSVQPIPIRKAPTPTDERITAVESTLAFLNLPTARPLVADADAVHVFVVGPEQLAHWMYELGGHITGAQESGGAALWTLHTETPSRADGSRIPIRVHVALMLDELAPLQFRTGGQVSA